MDREMYGEFSDFVDKYERIDHKDHYRLNDIMAKYVPDETLAELEDDVKKTKKLCYMVIIVGACTLLARSFIN